MRLSLVTAIVAFAVTPGVNADDDDDNRPDSFTGWINSLRLSQPCLSTLSNLTASDSPLSRCLNLTGLGSVLQYSNDSIVPKLDAYLKSVCTTPGCTKAVIDNTTAQVWSGCATDLSRNDIDQEELRTFMNAYPTVRNVSCLTSNSTGNSTLCPVKLLQEHETYRGRPISIQAIVGWLINSTDLDADDLDDDFADDLDDNLWGYLRNPAAAKSLLCNDCALASADIILHDYPQLERKEFDVGPIDNINDDDTNDDDDNNEDDDNEITIPQLFQTVCGTVVGANVTRPTSINSTASDDNDDDEGEEEDD